MQIKKLNESIDILKDGLGKSLIFADIWSVEDGMTLAEYGAETSTSAIGNKLLTAVNNTLKGVHVPPLGKYALYDLQGGKKLVLMTMNEYACAVFVDKDVQLGLFLHVVLPKFLDKFEEAVIE